MSAALIQVDVIIPTQTKYLDLIGSIGEQLAKKLEGYNGDKDALAYHLNLVLTEATANAIKHSADPHHGNDTVRILITIDDTLLNIKVFDHGQGFDLETVPLPDFEHPQEGGMGLFLIKNLMDSVSYTKGETQNVLEIGKCLTQP
ncbi:ATP-binding protein [Methylosoma difficile]